MTTKVPCLGCGAEILPSTAKGNNGLCMRCKAYGPPNADFAKDKTRRFGSSNPEIMNIPFWRYMVESKKSAYEANTSVFGGRHKAEEGPIWCFNRFGATSTEGFGEKTFVIGGEHEDYYDDDFCIYNDLVVFEKDGDFNIFGYPKEIFPPTDFHSATLIQDQIFIIGGLGYQDERHPDTTNIYRLDCTRLSIEKAASHGECPGWISEHTATFDEKAGVIIVTGGQLYKIIDGEGVLEQNSDTFSFEIGTGIWKKLA